MRNGFLIILKADLKFTQTFCIVAEKDIFILGIESSCDETSAAVLKNDTVLSNVIANQDLIHRRYGGVVPELASRAHQVKIVPVVEEALRQAKITKNDLHGVAFTRGPGLMGSLLVGVSFSKAISLALGIPLLEVNHMQGHILAHFIREPAEQKAVPSFPFVCMTVSGGHTQLVLVEAPTRMRILGETMDDAAGEAFDKAAKVLGLPYPGGPLIDKYAQTGDPAAYRFPIPRVPGLDYSFSGLKTAFINFVTEKRKSAGADFDSLLPDICASLQQTIVLVLLDKLTTAVTETGVRDVAIAGGVSANSGLRKALADTGKNLGWNVFIPPFSYCTDNAAMIAMAGYFKYLEKDFAPLDITPLARMPF
jgi:N6-L-threonylcarbamoyladenine synthase